LNELINAMIDWFLVLLIMQLIPSELLNYIKMNLSDLERAIGILYMPQGSGTEAATLMQQA